MRFSFLTASVSKFVDLVGKKKKKKTIITEYKKRFFPNEYFMAINIILPTVLHNRNINYVFFFFFYVTSHKSCVYSYTSASTNKRYLYNIYYITNILYTQRKDNNIYMRLYEICVNVKYEIVKKKIQYYTTKPR